MYRSYAATQGSTQQRQWALKLVIEAWLLYSFSKYLITGISSLYGLRQLRRNDDMNVECWVVSGLKSSTRSRPLGDAGRR